MSSVLYIVATPIGNLDDITIRAMQILRTVDIIAAEDTRHSQRLLNHLGLSQPMLSLHQHNEHQRVQQLLHRLQAGEDVALISDAGTPLISDPGFALVKAVQQAGYQASPIPGASSITAALSAAGMPTEPFTFLGFLSQKNNDRIACLAKYGQFPGTLVLLESSHRIKRLMQQLGDIMPHNRIVVAKELTKIHENFLHGQAHEILTMLADDPALCRGEFVIMIDNPIRAEADAIALEDIEMLKMLLAVVPLKQAVQLTSRFSGKKKNDLYQTALQLTAFNRRQ